MEIDSYLKEMTKLEEDLLEILIGTVALMPFTVTSSFDATITYTYVELKMLFPGTNAIIVTENVLTTFSLYV
jgi:hypothetical protein